MFDNKLFGENVRSLRKQLGLDIYNFSIQADLGYSHLSRIEHGSTPSIDTALHILNYLNIGFNESLNAFPIDNNKKTKAEMLRYFGKLTEVDLRRLLLIAKTINGDDDIHVERE